MNIVDAKRLATLLETMAKLEEAIAELYTACASKWPDEEKFWGAMDEEEKKHAQTLRQLAGALMEHPDQFEIGRLFSEVAINTVISGLKKHIEGVREGIYDRSRILNIANDLESSILELRYVEVLKTRNVGYQNLLSKVVQDTANHRRLLKEKLEASSVRKGP